ncbi:MAG: hypothetical protein ACK55Z_11690, partial [bacterium]
MGAGHFASLSAGTLRESRGGPQGPGLSGSPFVGIAVPQLVGLAGMLCRARAVGHCLAAKFPRSIPGDPQRRRGA